MREPIRQEGADRPRMKPTLTEQGVSIDVLFENDRGYIEQCRKGARQ